MWPIGHGSLNMGIVKLCYCLHLVRLCCVNEAGLHNADWHVYIYIRQRSPHVENIYHGVQTRDRERWPAGQNKGFIGIGVTTVRGS